jgi:hypothetical protein
MKNTKKIREKYSSTEAKRNIATAAGIQDGFHSKAYRS